MGLLKRIAQDLQKESVFPDEPEPKVNLATTGLTDGYYEQGRSSYEFDWLSRERNGKLPILIHVDEKEKTIWCDPSTGASFGGDIEGKSPEEIKELLKGWLKEARADARAYSKQGYC